MSMHETIFFLKSTNWYQKGKESERLKRNMLISFGLIPIGRLGKPPYQQSCS
jgi:hypothetical protein